MASSMVLGASLVGQWMVATERDSHLPVSLLDYWPIYHTRMAIREWYMEVQIVLTTDNSLFARIARALGARWTHAMLRFEMPFKYPDFALQVEKALNIKVNRYHIIEATMRRGVIERPWNPDRYPRWEAYRLADTVPFRDDAYNLSLYYAKQNKGQRYALERLGLLIPQFLRDVIRRLFRPAPRFLLLDAMSGTDTARPHICSSLVDAAFMYGGVDLVPDTEMPWVFPDDLARSPLLELVEEVWNATYGQR